MAVSAAVGALVALPALRLRGLYLALATFAFGVFVSRMVLTEISPRTLPLVHWTFTIFPSGTLSVARPKIGPIDLKSNAAFLVAVTIVFAVIGIALVAIRHSGYGRRLAALKDSPAACATLGMNVVRLKLSVFMLSAAIAGVGGALMTAQIGSAPLDRYDIFLSLSLLMLTVVGGIGYVSGALAGGLLFGVLFVAVQNTFDKLGAEVHGFEGLFDFLAHLATVAPALLGVSMGRDPTGAVERILTEVEPVRRARPVVAGGLAAVAVAYVLARSGAISNWWLIVICLAVALAMPLLAKQLVPAEAVAGAAASDGDGAAVPPELIGVTRPFVPGDRTKLDAALGLPAGAGREG
jgi:ABC-type branched-subunit amino acid transport system permease subunit